MNKPKISIIIKSNHDISAIASLLQQNNTAWECVVINNTIKDIEQYIINDNRFKILNDPKNPFIINKAIECTKAEYILLINSDSLLIDTAIDDILRMINLTKADIVKFKTSNIKEPLSDAEKYKCVFKYIFSKNVIFEYIFNSLSEFCFKKSVVDDLNTSEQVFLTNALIKAKDITVTEKVLIVKPEQSTFSINDIINNYKKNHEKLSNDFWKTYFKKTIQEIIIQTIKSNDKQTFIDFCKQIPLKLIPLRYRFICYILKKTNK